MPKRSCSKSYRRDKKIKYSNNIANCSMSALRQPLHMQDLIIKREDLKVGEKLGSGSYGVVHRGFLRGTPVAVKFLRRDATSTAELLKEVGLQIAITGLLHPALLDLHGLWECDQPPTHEGSPCFNMGLVLPLCRPKSVSSLLADERKGITNPFWNATIKSKAIFGTACGFECLHKAKIIHRDFKADNLLLTMNDEPVISDFGLARIVDVEMTTMLGNLMGRAPEVYDSGDYSFPADVFSFGSFLFSLFSSNFFLFDNGRHATGLPTWMSLIKAGRRPARPDGVPDFIWDMISACWQHAPDQRPTFHDLVTMLHDNTEKYAFPGADIAELKRYERAMLDPGKTDPEEYEPEESDSRCPFIGTHYKLPSHK